MEAGTKKYDLEARLVDYTCRMIDVAEALLHTLSGNYIVRQLIRSCHSPAFNYGEVQAAESRNCFIHKMKAAQRTKGAQNCFENHYSKTTD